MNWENPGNCFYLNQDRPVGNYIESITTIQFHTAVVQRKRYLPLKRNLSQEQLPTEACLICGFEQTRAKPTMDFDRRAQDVGRAAY